VQPDAKLEQQGAEGLGGAVGRVGHQQEPIGRGGHVGHGSSGNDRRSTAIAFGQLAGTRARRMSDGARRTADRLQPVARLRQQHKFTTVSRLSDEVSSANTLLCRMRHFITCYILTFVVWYVRFSVDEITGRCVNRIQRMDRINRKFRPTTNNYLKLL